MFVIEVLEQHVGPSQREAVEAACRIHLKGGVVLSLALADEATTTAERIVTAARGKGHPLVCRPAIRVSPIS